MSRLKYNNTCTAQGRNGISKVVGLDVYSTSRIDENNKPFGMIILQPENSQGYLTNCWIEIDLSVVPQLIKDLQYFYDFYNNATKTQEL